MRQEKLNGIYIPVITPFNKDESVNFSAIKELAKFLAENGVTGIIPSGSTGEITALEMDEQIAVNKAFIEAGHDNGIKVVASTGAYRTCDVVKMSQAAEADGADGIMAVTPWYMAPNEKELFVHYKTIHDAIEIPVMLYHNPYYSTCLMSDKFMAKLYNEGCIDAVKERQADVFRQQNLRHLTDDNFGIFYGYDVCPVETLSCWSDGWVCGTGNLFPKENSEVYHLAKAKKVEEAMEAEPTEEDLFRNLVIAQVTNYVNVRSIPSEEGEVLGKLYNNSVGTFISEENGWYQINSGSVTGYVKAEFCVTGEDAVELAKKVGKRIATVTTETLFVRTEPSTECSILGMVPEADDLIVLEETEGWAKVDVEEGMGWVSTDYVALHSEFVQAESKEEEERRLAKEEEERQKARAAAAQKAAQNQNNQSQSSAPAQNAGSYSVSGGSEMGVAVAEYGLQFVGNPYVYGGTSLTNGADCSGFVMSVYANFGVSLPHSSTSDRSQGYGVDGLDNAQPGDIICYSGHVGIYIGNGQIVHASNERTGIIVSNANYRNILAIRRIF